MQLQPSQMDYWPPKSKKILFKDPSDSEGSPPNLDIFATSDSDQDYPMGRKKLRQAYRREEDKKHHIFAMQKKSRGSHSVLCQCDRCQVKLQVAEGLKVKKKALKADSEGLLRRAAERKNEKLFLEAKKKYREEQNRLEMMDDWLKEENEMVEDDGFHLGEEVGYHLSFGTNQKGKKKILNQCPECQNMFPELCSECEDIVNARQREVENRINFSGKKK